MELQEALAELRKEKERKFDQTIDLIINLKGIDVKRDNIGAVIDIPHVVKERKICGFLTKESALVKTVLELDFKKYSDKKLLKKLVSEFDFFIAAAPLMPKVATTFGKVLGPAGKMPSPQLGILMQESEASIKQILDKINMSVKLRAKEPTIKLAVGKLSMSDEDISENIWAVYNALISVLPSKSENVKNILVKLTMSKPLKVEAVK